MERNWCALFIAIIKEDITVDKALIKMGVRSSAKGKRRIKVTDKDMKEMYMLRKQNWSYKQIGKKFGLSDYTISNRVKRYEEKVAM